MLNAKRTFVPDVLTATVCGLLLLCAPTSAQVWQLGTQWIYAQQVQAGSRFADSVASGDFNGDGYEDVVVGQPFLQTTADDTPINNAGSYSFYLGGPDGLSWDISYYTFALNGNAGWAVAAGDFDGDGRDEAVIGWPSYYNMSLIVCGQILVYDYMPGVGWTSSVEYRPGANGVPGLPEDYDNFGRSLAVGNFNGDAYEDLAIGSPGEDIEGGTTKLNAGAVTILYGSSSGLTSSASQIFTADSGDLDGAVDYQEFGFSITSGDFDDDGYDDLAIGSPFRDIVDSSTTYHSAGEIHVLYGSSGGLSTSGHQTFSSASLGGSLQQYQNFGYALAAADFDRSQACESINLCADDLAIGAPGNNSDRGAVWVSYGVHGFNLSHATRQTFTQSDLSGSSPEGGDRLGASLTAGEQDGRLGADLIIGVPEEDWNSETDQGMLHIVFGGAGKLGSYPGQWVAEVPTFGTPGQAGDFFSWSMALGDFNRDGANDLAVGVEGGWVEGQDNAGHLKVLYGGIFNDGFELNNASLWSATTP